jgi:hypothetical protein
MKTITILKMIIYFSAIFIISDRVVFAQPIYVSLPTDTTGEPTTSISIPITVGDLTDRGIISYQTLVTFNENILKATGAFNAGTLSSSFGPPTVNTAIAGQINVGNFGTSPLSGRGILVNLTFDIVGQPGDTTALIFKNFFFNSGEPAAVTSNGKFTVTTPTHIHYLASKPEIFRLTQNYPNPFNPETVIPYQLLVPAHVNLTVYNSLGQKIRTLVDENKQVGLFSICWNGRDDSERLVATGTYFCAFRAGEFRDVKKMLVLR